MGLSWLTHPAEQTREFREGPFRMAFTSQVSPPTNDGRPVARLARKRASSPPPGKIQGHHHNARPRPELVEAYVAALAAYLWQWEPLARSPILGRRARHSPLFQPQPARPQGPLSADLKATGWMFVGPTTAYLP